MLTMLVTCLRNHRERSGETLYKQMQESKKLDEVIRKNLEHIRFWGITMSKINVLSREITITSIKDEDYISLTDIARYKNRKRTDDLIRNWLRNRNTLEFLGIWEHLNNPAFKAVEFDGFRIQSGLNTFTLTPKQWREKTGAIGIISKAGHYGGTYAHKDIAFEFAS